MNIDYKPTNREATGMAAQLARFNAGQTPEDQLDEVGYVLAMAVKPLYAQYADQFDPATTMDISILRAAVKGDPAAAKAAIEAQEAAAAIEMKP